MAKTVKRVACALASTLLLAAVVPAVAFASDQVESQEQVTETVQFTASDSSYASTMKRSYASSTVNKLADRIAESFASVSSTVDVKDIGAEPSDISAAVSKAFYSNPDYFWLPTKYSYSYSYIGNHVTKITGFQYRYSKSTVSSMKVQFNKAVDKMVAYAKKGSGASAQVQLAHDYLVRNCSYVSGNNAHDAYGALVDRKAVCQGYSYAFKVVMDKLGIPCAYVTSSSLGHMWNMVKIGTKWYHVDVTWDDPLVNGRDEGNVASVRHTYLLKNDSYMHSNKHGSSWVASYVADGANYKADSATYSLSSAKVTGVKNFTYNGKYNYQNSMVLYVNGMKLKNGTDYSLTYSNNKSVGKAKIAVRGKGSVSGTKYVYFNVNPKGTSVKSIAKGKKSIKVNIKKQTAQTTGYKIMVSKSKNMKGAKTVTAGKNSSSKVVKGLKAHTKYYVKICTYTKKGGKTYCSGWSSAKSGRTI